MTVMIKEADFSDIEDLKAFEQELISYERGIEPTLIQSGKISYYDIPSLLADKENAYILIIKDNNLSIGCGFIEIKKNEPYYVDDFYGYIGLIYIDPKYRGKKLSSLLTHKLIKWAHNKDIYEVRLKVYASNKKAIQAYEKHNFVPYIYEMKLK